MRRAPLGFLALAGLVAASASLPAAVAASSSLHSAEGWVLVGFATLPPVEEGDALFGGRVLAVEPSLGVVALGGVALEEVRRAAASDPSVRYVETDFVLAGRPAFAPNDPLHADAASWAFRKVAAERAWDVTRGSTSVTVAVLDSGIYRGHEEFAGQARILPGHDFARGDADPEDECGHGTAVTGILAATLGNGKGMAGMAQVNVLPVKVMLDAAGNDVCSLGALHFAQGITYATDQGAQIITASLYLNGASSAVNDALAYARSRGVAVVGIAGNNGPCSDCVVHPWRGNGASAIVVSATRSDDTLAPFSGQGPEVDLSAPGEHLLTTGPAGPSDYPTWWGTSVAAPLVAGTLALMKSAEPSLTAQQMETRLLGATQDLGPAGWDPAFGHGRLRADVALQAPSTSTFDASFTGVKGNEWWIEAKVAGNKPLAGVDARVNGGAWKPLSLKSWGAWAASTSAPAGSLVQIQARATDGSTDLSGCYRWTAATPEPCGGTTTPPPPPPPPPPSGDVAFTHKGGNEWWVEVAVSPRPTQAQAMDTNGAWTSLSLKSWGSWAGSFRVEPGHQVKFRAMVDGVWKESCWFTHPGGVSQCGTTTPPPPPTGSAFDATFRTARGNEWWVEVDVGATGGTLAGVEARVNGGAWTALSKQSYGSWAKSLRAPAGSMVEFRARATDGSTDLSSAYRWPPG